MSILFCCSRYHNERRKYMILFFKNHFKINSDKISICYKIFHLFFFGKKRQLGVNLNIFCSSSAPHFREFANVTIGFSVKGFTNNLKLFAPLFLKNSRWFDFYEILRYSTYIIIYSKFNNIIMFLDFLYSTLLFLRLIFEFIILFMLL